MAFILMVTHCRMSSR